MFKLLRSHTISDYLFPSMCIFNFFMTGVIVHQVDKINQKSLKTDGIVKFHNKTKTSR